MRPQVKAFRDTAAQVCRLRGFPLQKFLEDYGLEEILNQADAANSPPEAIVERVLAESCVTNGKFNNFAVGFLTVMTYLNQQRGSLGAGEQQAFTDLGNILKKSPTQQAIHGWIQTHYP